MIKRKAFSVFLIVFLFLSFFSVLFQALPIVRADNTNHAVMFQNGTGKTDGCRWGQYDLFGYVAYGTSNPDLQIAFRDDTVTYDGHSSIRVEEKNAINAHREVNNYWITTPPGTQIIFRAYVKTSSDIATGNRAAIIGFDGISGTGVRLVEVAPQTSGDDNDSFDYPKTWNYEWVDYSSDWTLVEINVTIPNTLYTHDYKGNLLSTPERIAGILLFLGGNWQTGEAEADIWFADTVLYINPDDEPDATSGEETLQEGYSGASTGFKTVYSNYYAGQTFTVGDLDISLNAVRLNFDIIGTPGPINVSVKATTGGLPTGAILDTANITTYSSGWIFANFTGTTTLAASTMYAICVYVYSSNVSEFIKLYYSNINPYSDGTYISSDNSGSTWASTAANDFLFEVYGATSGDMYVLTEGSTVGLGSLTYDPINGTTDGVMYGSFIAVTATAGDGYVFSYANISNTVTGVWFATVISEEETPSETCIFSVQMITNYTVTVVFTLITEEDVPTVSIITPVEGREYTSANLTLTITATNHIEVWYNVMNGSSWIYSSNITYSDSTTLSFFETGTYTCYAWAASNDSYIAVDTAVFAVNVDATLPSVNMDAFWIFFYEGNFLGGIQSFFISSFLNLETAIALIAMLFLVPLYLRTKSLMLICVLWIMLGGFFIAAMPMASGLAVLFMALGVGGVVWRLFKSSGYG